MTQVVGKRGCGGRKRSRHGRGNGAPRREEKKGGFCARWPGKIGFLQKETKGEAATKKKDAYPIRTEGQLGARKQGKQCKQSKLQGGTLALPKDMAGKEPKTEKRIRERLVGGQKEVLVLPFVGVVVDPKSLRGPADLKSGFKPGRGNGGESLGTMKCVSLTC